MQVDPRTQRDLVIMQRVAPYAQAKLLNGRVIWVEEIITKLNEQYTLAYYYDGSISDYRVKVVHPRLEGLYSVVDGHLFADGSICLRGESDPRFNDVSEARAKAVLWCLSFGIYRQSGVFPMRTVRPT